MASTPRSSRQVTARRHSVSSLERGPFDLVTTDNFMPFMDGPGLVAAIRRGDTDVGPCRCAPSTVPVLFCSAALEKEGEDVPVQAVATARCSSARTITWGRRSISVAWAWSWQSSWPTPGWADGRPRQDSLWVGCGGTSDQQVHCVDPSSLTSRVPQLYTSGRLVYSRVRAGVGGVNRADQARAFGDPSCSAGSGGARVEAPPCGGRRGRPTAPPPTTVNLRPRPR